MIDIPRAFTYSFDDPQWTSKLVVTAIVTLVSALLTPLLIGLVGIAALMGYQIELIRNIRSGDPTPLPAWDDFSRLIGLGGNVLIALIVYNLPNVLIVLLMIVVGLGAGEGTLAEGLIGLLMCCFVPILIVYNLAIQPIFTLGMGRYSHDPRLNVFFEFGSLFAAVRDRTDLLIQWVLGMIVVGFVLGLANGIPCLGTIVSLALTVPIYGHLNGQYAAAVFDKSKRKNG